ncbi:MAG: protein kinase [Alphaproteobacteria bacterium]|nr:protein kinase [Alphaproteobacteria bacterium]
MGGRVLRPGDFIDMYRYERPIGKGGMAVVLLARDPGDRPVAIKVLKASRMRTGLARFRREFRALARLDHPNIIGVESWGDVWGHPYLAMEYVDGIDLHTHIRRMVRRPPAVRWPWTEDVLVQLLRALGHLSRRGLVHRDLKPSNILVNSDGTCKLTDFGIVKDLDPSEDPVLSTTLVGTWAYASPEQIAGDPVDHRSDLYSLGVILYAMLTGRRPFAAKDMGGYLELHRTKRPAPPLQLEPRCPPELADICLRLLAKSPRDRFQSAGEVLELLLDDESDEPSSSVDSGTGTTWTPPLVGREAPLGQAGEALSRLTRSEGGVLLIEGAGGSGRSRMLSAVVQEAARRELPVFEARIQQGDSAFGALLTIAREIGQELGGDTPPELARAIARFAQGQGRLPGDARYQLFDGVRTALSRLLDRGPQVVALDDLQDAPGPLLELLGYLVRTLISRDGRPLLLVATGRTESRRPPVAPAPDDDLVLDDVPDAGTWAAFRTGRDLGLHPQTLRLSPLDVADIWQLVSDLVGEGPATTPLAQRLAEETGGDALFVVEFLRGLLHRDLIVPRGDGGFRLTVDPRDLAGDRLSLPPGLRQAIRERLEPLDDDARTLLEVAAVAGRELDLEVLLDVVELAADDEVDEDTEVGEGEGEAAPAAAAATVAWNAGEDRWMDALDRTIALGLLTERRGGLGSTVSVLQRQVGEVVVEDLATETCRLIHRRLAAALELHHGASPVAAEAIGEHYRRAGDAARGYRYLVRAAVGLLERSLLTEAGPLLHRARALQAQAQALLPADEAAEMALSLDQVEAELHANRGDWDEAARALDALRRRANTMDRTEIAGDAAVQLGITLRRLGRGAEGEDMVRDVLVEARQRHDRRTELRALHALAGIAWSRGDLDGCEKLASQGLVSATGGEMAEGRAGILLALTAVQASKGQLASAIAGLSEAEELLRALREKKTRASVLCNLAELLTWQGDFAAAHARSEEALSLARDMVYRVVEASALRCRGLVRFNLGQRDRARLDLEAGLAIARELGLPEEEVPIRFLLALLALGDHEPGKAEEHAIAARSAVMRADPERFGPAIEAVLARSLAAQGHDEEARSVMLPLRAIPQELHAPRRTELVVLMAEAWELLGERAHARELALEATTLATRYQLRSWGLLAWATVARLADPDRFLEDAHLSDEARQERFALAEKARREGAALARTMLATLPPDTAAAFRQRQDVVTLLGSALRF